MVTVAPLVASRAVGGGPGAFLYGNAVQRDGCAVNAQSVFVVAGRGVGGAVVGAVLADGVGAVALCDFGRASKAAHTLAGGAEALVGFACGAAAQRYKNGGGGLSVPAKDDEQNVILRHIVKGGNGRILDDHGAGKVDGKRLIARHKAAGSADRTAGHSARHLRRGAAVAAAVGIGRGLAAAHAVTLRLFGRGAALHISAARPVS